MINEMNDMEINEMDFGRKIWSRKRRKHWGETVETPDEIMKH